MKLSLTGGVIVLGVIALIVAYGSLFTVYQTQQAWFKEDRPAPGRRS
jgi:hypothetical protein